MNKVCTRCRWHENPYVNCVGYFGPKKADLVFCGEAFGKSETEQYKEDDGRNQDGAFVGKAGDQFNELLLKIPVIRSEIVVMNALRCYQPNNPTPTKKEMDACFLHIHRDLRKIKPKLIVAMGAAALYQLTDKEGIEIHHGRMFWSDKVNCKVYCTYHPAYSLYDPKRWGILIKDFKRINELIDAEPDTIRRYEYISIETEKQFDEIFSTLLDKDLYIDSETTGLDPFKNEIKLIQLSNGIEPIYVIEGDLIPLIKDKLKILIESAPAVIGQEFDFDAKFTFTKLDTFPKNWEHDTCLAEYIISGMKQNDLDYLTGKYVPESFGYSDEINKAGGAHKIKDPEELRQYAADDVGVLKPIRRNQFIQLHENNTWNLFSKIWMPCNKVLTKMSLRGVKYDLNQLIEVDRKYEKKGEEVLEKIRELDSIRECERHFNDRFNPRSYKHVQWLLLDYYKLPVLKKTRKQNPSIGKEEMKRYANEHKNEYCKIMELFRSYQNIRDNFLSGVIPKLDGDIAHTEYSLHATASGRPTSKNPNILNIPSDDEEIKRCIVARQDHEFLYFDLKQIEIRVSAVEYYDPALIKICNTKDKDFHTMVTVNTNLTDLSYDEFFRKYDVEKDHRTEMIRREGKAVSFGILYQQTVEGLAAALNIPIDEAARIRDDYYAGFPGLKKGIEDTKQFLIDNLYLDTYFGFRRRWTQKDLEDPQTLREGVNHIPQGGAWNLMQLILIEVDKLLEGMKSALVMQIYDALVIEAHKSEIDGLAPQVLEIIEGINKPYPRLNEVLILADGERGTNLADMKRIE